MDQCNRVAIDQLLLHSEWNEESKATCMASKYTLHERCHAIGFGGWRLRISLNLPCWSMHSVLDSLTCIELPNRKPFSPLAGWLVCRLRVVMQCWLSNLISVVVYSLVPSLFSFSLVFSLYEYRASSLTGFSAYTIQQ